MNARLRRAGIALAAALGVWLGSAWALDVYGRGREAPCCYDAIVVLGARVRQGGMASGSLRRRSERAAELFQRGVAPRIVFTGSHVRDRPSEATIAAAVATRLGVPESAQVIEERSTNTLENVANARALIGPARVLVVTDSYHVLRAELVCRRYFPDARVVGVANRPWPQMREALREVLALGAYLIIG